MEIIDSIVALFSNNWVWLILLASIFYAAGNYIDELLLSEYEQEVGTLVLISTFFGGLIAIGFLGYAAVAEISIVSDKPLIVQALFVGVLEALWIIPYLYATERSGAIIAGPLFQVVPVFALVMESFVGVIPPVMQILGASIIVLGGVLLSIETEEDEENGPTKKVNWGTLGLMSLSALIVALIYVLFKDAAVNGSFVAIGFWTGIGMLLSGTAIYFLWQPYRKQFNAFLSNTNYKALGVQFVNELLDAGGVYMTHLANTLGPSVMVVTAFNATQPVAVGVMGAIISYLGYASVSSQNASSRGWLLLGTGILLIAAGIVILALGGYA